ncbi:MAG TPA: GNAT family N-acetyltransferase, partial [Coleofasciculaceae cyanobacterium]
LRSFAGEADLKPIAHLLNTCAVVDRLDRYHSVSDLRADYSEPGFDPSRDLRLWEDAQGQLIALAQLWVPQTALLPEVDGWLGLQVHPQHRDRGLEFDMLAWGEIRMQQVSQERGVPAKLYVTCRESRSDRIALYQKCGYGLERRFLRMSRSLAEPIAEPQLPQGFVLSHTRGVADASAWVEAYNHSFIDHWGFHPATVEAHCHWLNQANYRPELDLVAIAPTGQIAAFCFCHIDLEKNQHRHCKQGGINILGTRRGFRRLGLGRAMLLAGLQKLKAEGMETAILGVDTENPNQAQSLYASAGFQKVYANLSYAKQLGLAG